MSLESQARIAPTDEELAARFQATGDTELFAQIFARHRKLVLAACRRFFAASALAEDAAQETFLRAYQNIHRFHDGHLKGWLLSIARNVCIDIWRKNRPDAYAVPAELFDVPVPVDLEHHAAVQMAMAKVLEEMKSLAPEQRRCLEMKMHGYSYEETAAETGLSPSAVKSHIQNGRRMLWSRVQGFVSQLP